MSSCLVLQTKDKLYIGADTSSSVFINDKLYRLNDNTKKLFLLDNNTVLYCAGNNSIAEKVAQHISSIYCRNDFSLISLKNWLVERYPYKNKDKTVYDVEILIATFKNNRTIVYQMSQYKNYDIVSFDICDTGVQILSAGIKNTECMSFAENELLNKSGVKSIFRNTFNNLSCNYIGGCLDLYEITKNGAVKIFDNEKINEHGIQYVHDAFNGLSVSLNAEVLVSKLVMSENLWIENSSGNYKFNDSGFTATNGNNTIKIQPNNSGELFSIYNGLNKQVYINSNGDVEFAGTLKSASGQFSGLVSGGSINLGNGTFTVDKDGNMYASNCNISGNISSATINSSTISGGIINGGIINGSRITIGDNFKVDSSGNATLLNAVIGGKLYSAGATSSSDDDYFIYGVNINRRLQIGTPSTNAKYEDIRIFSPGSIYLFSNKDFTNSRGCFNENGLVVRGNVMANGGSPCFYSVSEATGSGNAFTGVSYSNGILTFNKGYTFVRSTSTSGSGNAVTGASTSDGVLTLTKGTTFFYTVNPATGSGNAFTGVSWNNGVLTFNKGITFAKETSSDQRLKYDIQDLNNVSDFYMALKPKSYRFKVKNEDDKIHTGLLAQQIISNLTDKGMDYKDYNIIQEYDIRDESDEGLYIPKDEKPLRVRYENLHAYHIAFGQELYEEIQNLKKTIKDLEEKI